MPDTDKEKKKNMHAGRFSFVSQVAEYFLSDLFLLFVALGFTADFNSHFCKDLGHNLN